MKQVITCLIAVVLAGCAKSSSEIRASYISPMQYRDWDCQQIAAEMQRVSQHANELAGVQDDKADNDAIATGVAVVLFWPAAFLVGGDGQTAAELARLKGEFEALERTSIEKKCGFAVKGKAAPERAGS
jgi:hypothetical protein